MAAAVVDDAVMAGRLVREGDIVRRPGSAPRSQDPAIAEAMDRLEAALVTVTPPPLAETARGARLPARRDTGAREGGPHRRAGGRSRLRHGDVSRPRRTSTGHGVDRTSRPATYRDATGTSRKYVMAILEDLDRRGILRRTPDGHVPVRGLGPRGTMTERVAAIVLAGGRSSRFGRDKLAEPIAGRPMLDHVVERLRLVATDIVVVGSTRAVGDIHCGRVGRAGRRSVRWPAGRPGRRAALARSGPGARPRRRRRHADAGPRRPRAAREWIGRREAAVLADADGPRPLPLAVRRSVASPAAQRVLESGERRLRALLGELDVEVIPPDTWQLDDPTGETLRDVDVPGDLPDQWPEARP